MEKAQTKMENGEYVIKMNKPKVKIDMLKMKMTKPELILKNLELRPHYGKDNSRYFMPLHMKRGKEVSEILRNEYKNYNYLVNLYDCKNNSNETNYLNNDNIEYKYENNHTDEEYYSDSSLDNINYSSKSYYYSESDSSDSVDDYD